MSAGEPAANERLTLVGAGPVGSLLALFLARHGFSVDIYERRSDMRKEDVSAGRSINLALSERGLHALRQIGLEKEILEQSVPMRGRMIHSLTGELAFQPYGKDDSQYLNSMSRGFLNQTLMDAAETTGKVRFFFHKRISDYHVDTSEIVLQDELSGRSKRVCSPVLFGTDGSSSAIRQAMMQLPGYQCRQEILDYGYKELHIPPAADGGFAMEKNALHIWPRGTYMLIALPNFQCSYTCTLFLPFEGPLSFAELNTPEKVNDFFRQQFPDALPLIEDLGDTFFSNPTGHMSTIKAAPWHVAGNALLSGDAAHAMVPFFGQGLNCGFEDCTILDECIKRNKTAGTVNWQSVFLKFFQLRKSNTDAIADMAVENFIEMRDKVASKPFLLRKAVERILENSFPGQYFSRYSLVTFSRIPYRAAFDAGSIGDEIISELCENLSAADKVDLKKAQLLIETKLTPFLKGWQQELACSAYLH